MRDSHLYIIIVFLLLVLLSMSQSEGFVGKSAAHASHTTTSRQIGGPHKGDIGHFFRCTGPGWFGMAAKGC